MQPGGALRRQGRQLERELRVVGGGLEGRGVHRLERGLRVERGQRLALRFVRRLAQQQPRRVQVMQDRVGQRQLGVGGEVSVAQQPADAQLQRRPLVGRDALQRRLLHAVMGEGVAHALAGLSLQLRGVAVQRARRHQQLRLQRRQQVGGQGVGGHVQRGGQAIQAEVRAQQRRHAQRLARRIGQALELLQHQRDDVVRRARRRDAFERMVPALRRGVVVDQAAAHQVLEQAAQEERIAGGAGLAQAREFIQAGILELGIATQAVREQAPRVVQAQRSDAQGREALAELLAEFRQLLRDRMAGRGLVVPVGDDEQRVAQRRVVQAFAQQPARRAVGPLPVIEE